MSLFFFLFSSLYLYLFKYLYNKYIHIDSFFLKMFVSNHAINKHIHFHCILLLFLLVFANGCVSKIRIQYNIMIFSRLISCFWQPAKENSKPIIFKWNVITLSYSIPLLFTILSTPKIFKRKSYLTHSDFVGDFDTNCAQTMRKI